MPALTVSAVFPTGQFNAHDADGHAEWPPAPARVLAALLGAAHRLGEGVAEVESLFSAPAPLITGPAVGLRDTGFGRWVPVNNELQVRADGTMGIVDRADRFGERQQKAPERGVLVGTGPQDVVRWTWEVPDGAAPRVLRRVARSVEYLGRPTSPVLLDVSTGPQPDPIPGASAQSASAPGASARTGTMRPEHQGTEVAGAEAAELASPGAGDPETGLPEAGGPAGHLRWEPHPDGWLHLRVGTPALLGALAAREEERRRSQMTGEHPVVTTCPTAPYLLVGAAREGVRDGAAVPTLLRSCALYRVGGGGSGRDQRFLHAGDVATMVSQVRDVLGPGGWVLPLVGPEGRRGLRVLRGVVVCEVRGPARLELATRTGVWQMRLHEARSLRSLPRVLWAATRAARTWTSVVPTPVDDATLLEASRSLARSLGVVLTGVEAHEASRSEGAVDVDGDHGLRHVTVQVDAAVPGPVSLDGALLVPAGASGLAVARGKYRT